MIKIIKKILHKKILLIAYPNKAMILYLKLFIKDLEKGKKIVYTSMPMIEEKELKDERDQLARRIDTTIIIKYAEFI